jgi:hypothetical protein
MREVVLPMQETTTEVLLDKMVGDLVLVCGLLPSDDPLNFFQDLLGLLVGHDATLNCVEVHLLVDQEVPVELEGLAQLDGIGWHLNGSNILLLLKANNDSLLAFLLDSPPHEGAAMGEGSHSLSTAHKDQLVIGGLLHQHVLGDELLQGHVAFVVPDAEVDHMLQ